MLKIQSRLYYSSTKYDFLAEWLLGSSAQHGATTLVAIPEDQDSYRISDSTGKRGLSVPSSRIINIRNTPNQLNVQHFYYIGWSNLRLSRKVLKVTTYRHPPPGNILVCAECRSSGHRASRVALQQAPFMKSRPCSIFALGTLALKYRWEKDHRAELPT